MRPLPLRLPWQRGIDRLGPALSLLLLLGITIASLMPRGGAGDPGRLGTLAHLLAYGVASLPVTLTTSTGRAWAPLVILAWSALIEVLQPLVGRSYSLGDLAANMAGIVIALTLATLAKRLLGR